MYYWDYRWVRYRFKKSQLHPVTVLLGLRTPYLVTYIAGFRGVRTATLHG